MAICRIEIKASLDEIKRCLQLVRKWDNARDEVKVAMVIDAPEASMRDVIDVFDSLDPPVPYRDFIPIDGTDPSVN